MKVLHIDDSPEICKLYADWYSNKNYSVTSINDGKKGLELVLQNDYDIILLDMCMPRYGGINFLYDLKNQRPSELKKIIVLSVLPFNEDQIKGLKKFGVKSVEEKPAHIQQLESLFKDMSQKGQNMADCLKKMLIVDDNPETTTLLTEFFSSKGFDALSVNDPWEGLKKIRQGKFDVIILDLVMPEFSGFQIIATLASEEILQDQNIFIYSANLGNENQIKDLLRREGISGCLKKPMNLYDMLKMITEKSDFQKISASKII